VHARIFVYGDTPELISTDITFIHHALHNVCSNPVILVGRDLRTRD
jgi:hypothetical protein